MATTLPERKARIPSPETPQVCTVLPFEPLLFLVMRRSPRDQAWLIESSNEECLSLQLPSPESGYALRRDRQKGTSDVSEGLNM